MCKYTCVFFIIATLNCYLVLYIEQTILQVVVANIAICFFSISLAYGGLGPKIFSKKTDGRLSWFSYLVYWPFIVLSNLGMLLYRFIVNGKPYHQIIDNLYLGGRLFPGDRRQMQQYAIVSTLDLTAELSEVAFLRNATNYLCIPVLDACAPTIDQLRTGVSFIKENIDKGTVYVHCAMGHGRSATFVLAYLMSLQTKSWQELLQEMQKIRPGVQLHKPQSIVIEAYEKVLRSSQESVVSSQE